MDRERFKETCDKVINNTFENKGVGTLQEKTIHSVLKYYFEPDERYHEHKVEGFVADIEHDGNIIEIQSRNFYTMRRKLDAFLPEHKVMIVYPVYYRKWLRWVNEESGEISAPRKSPKVGSAHQIFPELYRIKPYLKDPNLQLCVALIEVEEYRLLNGWSKDKKKGSSRNDGIPTKIQDEVYFRNLDDYKAILNTGLPERFTSKDYKAVTKLPVGLVSVELNILEYIGAIQRVGKDGRCFLYERAR